MGGGGTWRRSVVALNRRRVGVLGRAEQRLQDVTGRVVEPAQLQHVKQVRAVERRHRDDVVADRTESPRGRAGTCRCTSERDSAGVGSSSATARPERSRTAAHPPGSDRSRFGAVPVPARVVPKLICPTGCDQSRARLDYLDWTRPSSTDQTRSDRRFDLWRRASGKPLQSAQRSAS